MDCATYGRGRDALRHPLILSHKRANVLLLLSPNTQPKMPSLKRFTAVHSHINILSFFLPTKVCSSSNSPTSGIVSIAGLKAWFSCLGLEKLSFGSVG